MPALKKADINDCTEIHAMQIKAFMPLLEKYGDIETNPAAEPVERIIDRMKQEYTDYCFICLDDINIGAIRIVRLGENECRISPMFILPEFQGCGYAQTALALAEEMYPNARCWSLDTIKQENKLRHIYEKSGYVATGKEEKIQEGMTIIHYEKRKNPAASAFG